MSGSTWWFRQQAFQSHKAPKQRRRSLYRCSNQDCTQRTTQNQARGSRGHCPHCKHPLRAWKEFQ